MRAAARPIKGKFVWVSCVDRRCPFVFATLRRILKDFLISAVYISLYITWLKKTDLGHNFSSWQIVRFSRIYLDGNYAIFEHVYICVNPPSLVKIQWVLQDIFKFEVLCTTIMRVSPRLRIAVLWSADMLTICSYGVVSHSMFILKLYCMYFIPWSKIPSTDVLCMHVLVIRHRLRL